MQFANLELQSGCFMLRYESQTTQLVIEACWWIYDKRQDSLQQKYACVCVCVVLDVITAPLDVFEQRRNACFRFVEDQQQIRDEVCFCHQGKSL